MRQMQLSFLEAGKEYTVSGFLNWFNNPQVTPIAEGAVVEILPQKTVEGTELVMADLGFENATPISWVKFTDGELRASAGTGSNAPTYILVELHLDFIMVMF